MARGWRLASVVTAAGFAILLAAVLLGRLWLVEIAVRAILERNGFESARFVVAGVGPNGVALRHVDLGQDGSARSLTLVRNGWQMADWELRASEVTAVARYEAEGGFGFGGLSNLENLAAGGGSDGAGSLPRLAVGIESAAVVTRDGILSVTDATVKGGGRTGIFAVNGSARLQSRHVSLRTSIGAEADAMGATRFELGIEPVLWIGGQRIVLNDPVDVEGDIQPDYAELRVDASMLPMGFGFSLRAVAAAPFDRPVFDATAVLDLSELRFLRKYFPHLPDMRGEARMGWHIGGVLDIQRLLQRQNAAEAFDGEFAVQVVGDVEPAEGPAAQLTLAIAGEGQVTGGLLSARFSEAGITASRLRGDAVPQVLGAGGGFPLVGHQVNLVADPGLAITGPSPLAIPGGADWQYVIKGAMEARSLGRARLLPGSILLSREGVAMEMPVLDLELATQATDESSKAPTLLKLSAASAWLGTRLVLLDQSHIRTSWLPGRAGPHLVSGKDWEMQVERLSISETGLHATGIFGTAESLTIPVARDYLGEGEFVMQLSASEVLADRSAVTLPDLLVQIQGSAEEVNLAASGALSMSRAASGFDGMLTLDIPAAGSTGWSLEGMSAELPIRFSGDEVGSTISLDGGEVRLNQLSVGSSLRSIEPANLDVSGTLQAGPCTLRGCGPDIGPAAARIAAPGLDLLASGLGEVALRKPVLKLDFKPPTTRRGPLMHMEMELERAAAPWLGSAERIRISGPLDPAKVSLNHAISASRVETRPIPDLPLPAFRLDGQATGLLSDARFEGQMIAIDEPLPPADIVADRSAISGRLADVPMEYLARSPVLKAWLPESLDEVEGAVTFDVTHHFPEDRTALTAEFREVGVTTDVGSFSALNGVVRALSISPFVTSGPQELSVALVDAGAKLGDLRITLDAGERDGAPFLRVANLSGRMFGGRFRFDPVTVSAARLPEIVLRLDGLSLQALTDLAGFEDFSMGGSISGVVPFAIDGQDRIAIRDARLAADGPGAMRLRLDSIRSAIEQQMGEQADLLLAALEDFHYTVLTAQIDKAFGENEQAKVRLEGSNPAHLDGQPFIFNISLDSNVVRLADTILALYRATLGEVQALALKARQDR